MEYINLHHCVLNFLVVQGDSGQRPGKIAGEKQKITGMRGNSVPLADKPSWSVARS